MGVTDYFAITTESNLSIREECSASSTVIGSIPCGATFQVITENGKIIERDDEDDSKKSKWTKAVKGDVTGWVSSEYIRPDKVEIIELSTYSLDKPVEITVHFKDKTQEKNFRTPSLAWAMLGSGQYPRICKKVQGRWCVAVGPSIFNKLYSTKGRCLDTDIRPFSKFIKAKLRHITTKAEITEEFCICDIKAHTFHEYGYDEQDKSKDLDAGHFVSDGVEKVEIKPKIKHGMIQTAIRFPNASNPLVVGRIKSQNTNNIDFSIIEFCGGSMSDYGKFRDYELVSITTNYEKDTRGKRYSYDTGQEIIDETKS